MMTQQPYILPNSVSSVDWSAAETNLDIVLIQFYRCKLCNNKFSSLSRSLVVAHMMQVHEPEWKAACKKVKELKSKETLETVRKIADGKPTETINTPCRKNALPPKRHFFSKRIHGDSMVARDDTGTRKVWKRPAGLQAENDSPKKNINPKANVSSCGIDATDNLTNSISPEGIVTSNLTTNNSISSASITRPNASNVPGLAVLSVKNGIAFVTEVSQPTGQPTAEAAVNRGKPVINLNQHITHLSQHITNIGEGVHVFSTKSDADAAASKKTEQVICKQCGYVCSSWNEHWTHSHEHLPTAEKVRYQCHVCKLNFGSQGTLQQHQESNPECRVQDIAAVLPKKLKCVLCNFETRSSHSLKIHNGQMHKQGNNDVKIVYCPACSTRFSSVRSLRRHRKDGKCGRTKRGRPKGIQGKKRKPRPPSVPKVLVCDLCDRTFDKNSRYSDHYATHFEERRQKCSVCDKAFKTKRSLRNHMVMHRGKKFSCDLCEFHTFWGDSLKKHKDLKHFSEHLPYHSCSICPYKSKDLSALKSHERHTHCQDKDYICETCGKSFKLASALKCHQETHNKEIQYPCDKCDYVGSTRFNLYSHKSVHIAKEQMQFKCDQCSWIGRRSSELTRHKRKHSDDKLYYCHHCGLGYKHKHGLTRHLKEKHVGHAFATVEMSETDDANIYTDDIIVAQVFEV